jgi:hypothetical protein
MVTTTLTNGAKSEKCQGKNKDHVIASASVKIPRHVSLFYAPRARKILGKTVKFNPGF